MKREIVCVECYERLKPERKSYPGEYIKAVHGTARESFLCDICGKSIPKGDKCIAQSIWADYGGIPYYEWEFEYVERY